MSPASPRDAQSAGTSLALVPEDRKTDGLMLPMSVRENLGLAALQRVCRFGVIDRARESESVQQAVRQLAGESRPTLVCAYGEDRAIRVTGRGGLFDFDAAELALPLVLQRMVPSELRPPAAP